MRNANGEISLWDDPAVIPYNIHFGLAYIWRVAVPVYPLTYERWWWTTNSDNWHQYFALRRLEKGR